MGSERLAGHGLAEPLFALMRWGLRFLQPEPGDHIEPDWVGLGLRAFARRGASPARRVTRPERPSRTSSTWESSTPARAMATDAK